MENKNITWSAKEFVVHPKTKWWYIAYAVLSAALITYGWFSHNLLTLLTFVVIVGIVYLFSHQHPQEVEFQLTTTGVIIGEKIYPYRIIKNFWIIYTPENKTVNFETTAYLNNRISLQLGNQDPLPVKEFLKSYIQEDLDREESFSEILARKIKF